MNTIPQFIKEFANAQRKSYINNALMQEKYKNLAVEMINRILRSVEHGLITINEGMRELCDPLDGICEKGGISNVR